MSVAETVTEDDTAAAEAGIATEQTAGHSIKARRLQLDYDSDPLPKYFMEDEVMSHIVAVLSALFPEGEDFFVRSVRHYRDQITDPTLKKQVAGFIGQEANHGREHRNFNARLQALGYPTARVDRLVRRGLAMNEKTRSPEVCLAVTAALEHYTATLAEVLLTDARAREMFTSDEARELLVWHALEESEHKAVAFDVYQSVVGDQKLRARVMRETTFWFLFDSILQSTLSILADRQARRPKVLWANLKKLRQSPWLTREVRRRIRDYNRPDFHPDDYDNAGLTAEWRERLFGDGGELADRIRKPTPSAGADAA
jgi:predicted metal-dependent hydrolase